MKDVESEIQTAGHKSVSDSAAETLPKRSLMSRIFGFEEAGLLLALVTLALIIGIPHPEFFDPRSLVTVLRQSAFVGIVALGVVYLIAMVEIDLSVGALYLLAATLPALLIESGGVDPWLAVAASLLVLPIVGGLNGLLANLLTVPIIIVSLGTLSVIRGAAFILSDGRALTGMPREHPFFVAFGSDWLGIPVPVWFLVFIGVVLHFVFWKTRFGAVVRAIGSNIHAAEFIGIRVPLYRIYVTALVGFLCGISGVLTLAFFKSSDPSLGTGMELQVVAAVVIGGTSLAGGSGSLLGAFIGVILISMIGSGLVFYGISGNWAEFVTGVVIIAAIALDRTIKRRRAPDDTTGSHL
jgi:ribose transport system permease protein